MQLDRPFSTPSETLAFALAHAVATLAQCAVHPNARALLNVGTDIVSSNVGPMYRHMNVACNTTCSALAQHWVCLANVGVIFGTNTLNHHWPNNCQCWANVFSVRKHWVRHCFTHLQYWAKQWDSQCGIANVDLRKAKVTHCLASFP